MQTPHESRICPIDFEVKRSKVKVTMHRLLKMVSFLEKLSPRGVFVPLGQPRSSSVLAVNMCHITSSYLMLKVGPAGTQFGILACLLVEVLRSLCIYLLQVGPAGAQFGILACLLVEVLQSLQMLKRPCIAILKIGGFITFLFLLGLLPWIDNWAHICGFLFGLLLAFAILPYVSFGQFDRRRKIIGIILSLSGAIGLFVVLIILFYVLPLYNCPGCQYFNCIPLTEDFCKNMEVTIDRKSTYSSKL